jgi:hypothetical protein
VICWVAQELRHATLAVALLVVVAALVGGVPGTMQATRQAATCELQVIMHVVVVEVCASCSPLPLPAATAPTSDPISATKAKPAVNLRTPAYRICNSWQQHSGIAAGQEMSGPIEAA